VKKPLPEGQVKYLTPPYTPSEQADCSSSLIIIIILTYLIRVNPSAKAVIKGCPEQLKIELK